MSKTFFFFFRERIVHLLAVRPLKKPELLARMIGGKFETRDRPRFFDQVGHQTPNVSIGNKYFFTK